MLPGRLAAKHAPIPPWPRSYRALLFVALGLWGLVPGLHAWLANAGESAFAKALALDLLMGAIYIVSAGSRVRGWQLVSFAATLSNLLPCGPPSVCNISACLA